jgi:2-haloacid dehalogenase
MQAYQELGTWPDVRPAVGALREKGLRLAFLSSMTAEMLSSGCRRNGLDGIFDPILSTDRIRSYKPDPHAYQMGVDALGLGATRFSSCRSRGGTRRARNGSATRLTGSTTSTRRRRS